MIKYEKLSYIWRLINAQWHSHVHRLLEEKGLTHTERMVLMTLNLLKKPTKSDLANTINVRPQSLTRALHRLTEIKLINKNCGKTDQRAIQLELTAKGKTMAITLTNQNQMIWKKMMRGFTNQEKKEFSHQLERALENLTKEN